MNNTITERLAKGEFVLIAEIGVNYYDIATKLNISLMEAAKFMVLSAKNAGIHAVKFQTYKAGTLAAKKSPSYWDTSEEPTTSQYELFQKFDHFGEAEYKELHDFCEQIGIEFCSTPFDLESADYLNPLMNVYKISSSDLSNLPFIEYMAKKNKPIILSIGASNENEICKAVDTIEKYNDNKITLLHCVLEYPTPYEHANLAKIRTLKEKFPQCYIGYSDHTKPDASSDVIKTAYLLGAQVVEKHFTLDKKLIGNDHYHAMDPHDAEEILKCQLKVLQSLIIENEIHHDEIAAIGITNQRETVVVWDKKTGKPIYNAIVWQCRRSADYCEKLIKDGYKETIRDKTGLLIDAYFTATKLKWILDNVKDARSRSEKGELLAGTIDTWLIWKLSGGKCHVTDFTNASRTMLFNIHTLDWDEDLLSLFDIPRSLLPSVKDSSCVYCNSDSDVCGFSVPIASSVGDQQAALFGQGCFKKGDAKNTYGTGCFMLMNTGDVPVYSDNLLTTIALGLNGKISYALEGSVFIGGAVIKWLRDELELISSAPEIDRLAESVLDANGCYLVPAFVGLGTPYWDMYARGTIVGLTRGVKKAHICRAALEAIAFEVRDVLDAMVKDSQMSINMLNVDGGACVSDIMMQFQSDILNVKVCRPKNVETTALGAAYLAGLAVGIWKDKDEILVRVFRYQLLHKV